MLVHLLHTCPFQHSTAQQLHLVSYDCSYCDNVQQTMIITALSVVHMYISTQWMTAATVTLLDRQQSLLCYSQSIKFLFILGTLYSCTDVHSRSMDDGICMPPDAGQ